MFSDFSPIISLLQEIAYRHFRFRRFLYHGWMDELFETRISVSIVASTKAYLANKVSNTLFSLAAKAGHTGSDQVGFLM